LASGIPLVIRWAIGRIGLGDSYSQIVSKLKRGEVELSEFCVADSFEMLKGRKAEEIVLVLTLPATPVNKQVLGDIADVGKEYKLRDDELADLENLQLVVKHRGDRFSITPLAKTHVLNSELYAKERVSKMIEKWARHYIEFTRSILGEHGRVDGYSNNTDRIWGEMDNILEVLRAIQDINLALYCELLEQMRYILYLRGNWVERDQYMLKGIEASEKNSDPCRKLLFASDIAWVATYRGEYDRALHFFQSVDSAIEDCSSPYYRAKFFTDLGRFYHLSGYQDENLPIAEKYYMMALDEASKIPTPTPIQSTTFYYLGLFYYQKDIKPEARRLFEEGIKVAETCGAAREANRHKSMLALILAENGQYDEARKIFENIILAAASYKDNARQADYKLGLARIEYMAGHRGNAQILLSEAERMYTDLGRIQDVRLVAQFRKETGLEANCP